MSQYLESICELNSESLCESKSFQSQPVWLLMSKSTFVFLQAMREAEKGDDDDGEEGEEEEEEEEEEDGVDEMMEEIEAQLADEFEEEEEGEEEEDESEEDAVDRMKNDLNEVYDNDTNRLSTLKVNTEMKCVNLD